MTDGRTDEELTSRPPGARATTPAGSGGGAPAAPAEPDTSDEPGAPQDMGEVDRQDATAEVDADAGAGTQGAQGADVTDVAELQRQRDEYLDMVRRVQADFENYKKRMVRQQTELLERAAEGLVTRLFPVLDAFDLARAHLEAEGSPEGRALLQAAALLDDTLAKEGLERVDDVDVPFDPTTHEAVEHLPADEAGAEAVADPGASFDGPLVTGVLRAGYRYKGRVVRPAMVRVKG